MTLVNRPAPAGDRLAWRSVDTVDETRAEILRLQAARIASEPIDSTERELGAHRAEGIRKALDYLRGGVENGRSENYRQARAILALAQSVQRQALVAGLGHLHVGTTPCGPMCEPLDGAR